MADGKRNIRIYIRMNEEEYKMAKKVALKEHKSMSQMVRNLIEEQYFLHYKKSVVRRYMPNGDVIDE